MTVINQLELTVINLLAFFVIDYNLVIDFKVYMTEFFYLLD